MNRREQLLAYAPLADFIAKMNGEGCEALIHDVSDPAHSVIYVTRPSLTGRQPGDGMTDYAVELIRTKRCLSDDYVVNYLGGSPGRVFRSSTYFIRERGKEGELIGLLCVNVDIAPLLEARALVDHAMILDPALLIQGQQESFPLSVSVDERLERVCARYGGNLSALPTARKRQLTLELRNYGVFELKGKVAQVAELLNVSEKTVYRYLKAEDV